MVEQIPPSACTVVWKGIPGCQGLKSTQVSPSSSVWWESYPFTVSKGFICNSPHLEHFLSRTKDTCNSVMCAPIWASKLTWDVLACWRWAYSYVTQLSSNFVCNCLCWWLNYLDICLVVGSIFLCRMNRNTCLHNFSPTPWGEWRWYSSDL